MDNSFVKEIRISKNDRFYFSRKYDREKISPQLVEIDILSRTIKDIPILPEFAAKFDEEVIRRSIFGTTAIEGNPLTEEDVGRIISVEKYEGKEKSTIEVRNIKTAYEKIDAFPEISFFRLKEDFIQLIHSTVMLDLGDADESKGYRHGPVTVGDKEHGGTDHPPKSIKDINLLMNAFVGWINDDSFISEHRAIRAALAHYHLALIHPFADGNGRTSRLVEALLLQTAGYKFAPKMLSNYYYQHIDDYYRAFSLSRKNKEKEVTPFLELFLNALVFSLATVKSRILDSIRFVVLRNHYLYLLRGKKINQRQVGLLSLLLEKPIVFSVSDLFYFASFAILYRGISERTARRDLLNLYKQNLLTQTEEGKYELNIHALDSR